MRFTGYDEVVAALLFGSNPGHSCPSLLKKYGGVLRHRTPAKNRPEPTRSMARHWATAKSSSEPSHGGIETAARPDFYREHRNSGHPFRDARRPVSGSSGVTVFGTIARQDTTSVTSIPKPAPGGAPIREMACACPRNSEIPATLPEHGSVLKVAATGRSRKAPVGFVLRGRAKSRRFVPATSTTMSIC